MKEYRLKKWYPSLPVDWKNTAVIVVEREHGYNLHPSLKVINLTEETIRYTEVNNPEFWEQVLPKEFTILSFELRGSNVLGTVNYATLRENGLYVNSNSENAIGVYSDYEILRRDGNNKWKIYKVRRESDGVEFTIGDTVVRHADKTCHDPVTTPRRIKFFYFEDDRLKFGVSSKDQGYVVNVFSHIEIPKEWEILRFEYKDTGFIGGAAYTELKENGLYLNSERPNAKGMYTLEHVLSNKNWTIQKVRRVSDGVEFTIGDMITAPFRDELKKMNISEFTLTENKDLYIVCKGDGISCSGVNISIMQPIPKPIFIADDGGEVYALTTFYTVNKHNGEIGQAFMDDRPSNYCSAFKRFVSKENAERYANMLTSTYTIDDIILITQSILQKDLNVGANLRNEVMETILNTIKK